MQRCSAEPDGVAPGDDKPVRVLVHAPRSTSFCIGLGHVMHVLVHASVLTSWLESEFCDKIFTSAFEILVTDYVCAQFL